MSALRTPKIVFNIYHKSNDELVILIKWLNDPELIKKAFNHLLDNRPTIKNLNDVLHLNIDSESKNKTIELLKSFSTN